MVGCHFSAYKNDLCVISSNDLNDLCRSGGRFQKQKAEEDENLAGICCRMENHWPFELIPVLDLHARKATVEWLLLLA